MKNEWINLTGIVAVAMAQANGWEIEIDITDDGDWERWYEKAWLSCQNYRGRPAKPKTITVTSNCWRDSATGNLVWLDTHAEVPHNSWKRFPVGDFTEEVENDL